MVADLPLSQLNFIPSGTSSSFSNEKQDDGLRHKITTSTGILLNVGNKQANSEKCSGSLFINIKILELMAEIAKVHYYLQKNGDLNRHKSTINLQQMSTTFG